MLALQRVGLHNACRNLCLLRVTAMHNDSDPPTSATLLGRLRQSAADQHAWGKFVDRYSPKIYAWCRRWGLQEADAQDVTQSVLVKLVEKMRVFVYDPAQSFRGWLRTLTHHAWYDFVQARQRPGKGAGDSRVVEVLQAVEARDDLVGRLEAEFDRELLDEDMAGCACGSSRTPGTPSACWRWTACPALRRPVVCI